MGTPHNAQTPKDGLPRCKQRELRAYLVPTVVRALNHVRAHVTGR
jgi:hypothetical protein